MNLLLEWFRGYLYPLKSEPCRFYKKEKLDSPLISMILIKKKYLLHIINEIISMISLLKDLIYTYNKYREIITLV